MTDASIFLGSSPIAPGSPEPIGFNGLYRGLVTNTTDPSGQNRIKAIVPQLFGNTSTECDWALPCQPPGLQAVPSPGQGVWIMFEGGDINYPVYAGMWQAEPSVAPYAPGPGSLYDSAGAATAAGNYAINTSKSYTNSRMVTGIVTSVNGQNCWLSAATPIPAVALWPYVPVDEDVAVGFYVFNSTSATPSTVLYLVGTVPSTPGGWIDVAAGVGFNTGWSNYGNPFHNAAYRRVGDVVQLRGVVNSGTGTGPFSFPAGFQPSATVALGLYDASIGIINQWQIGSNGAGVYWPGAANHVNLLDGLFFSIL